MTLLSVENIGKKAQVPTFDTWFDQLFDFATSIDWSGWHGGKKSTVPAVNIKEDESSFQLAVAAPGFSKEDFKLITTMNNLQFPLSVRKKCSGWKSNPKRIQL